MLRKYSGRKFLALGFLGVTLFASIVAIFTMGISGGALPVPAEPRPASTDPPCL